MLELENVTMNFGAVQAIDGLDLLVKAGSRHALIGSNGAGKTTLMNLIAGSLRPTSGRVLFEGKEISTMPVHRRVGRGICRMFQHPVLLTTHSAVDNVVLAAARAKGLGWKVLPSRQRELRRWAGQQLGDVGLPASEHTVASGQLSHAHQRHVELAVALASSPRLLLLDEPTAGLSPQDTATLVNVLRQLPSTITLIVIDHDLDAVLAVADTVTTLEAGRIVP
jgi:branched-chain amino acid transport system ATP-binding protein